MFQNWGAIMSVNSDLICSFEVIKPEVGKIVEKTDTKKRPKTPKYINWGFLFFGNYGIDAIWIYYSKYICVNTYFYSNLLNILTFTFINKINCLFYPRKE